MRKRVVVLAAAVAVLALPSAAPAFHHVFLPAPTCAADESGGNAGGNNPRAREALLAAGQTLPLPPFGTPGQQRAPNTPAEERCANEQP